MQTCILATDLCSCGEKSVLLESLSVLKSDPNAPCVGVIGILILPELEWSVEILLNPGMVKTQGWSREYEEE